MPLHSTHDDLYFHSPAVCHLQSLTLSLVLKTGFVVQEIMSEAAFIGAIFLLFVVHTVFIDPASLKWGGTVLFLLVSRGVASYVVYIFVVVVLGVVTLILCWT